MKVSVKYWRSCIVLAVVAVVLFGTVTAFAAQNPNPGVLPPQSHPHGHTYGEWSNAWWQWALSIPTPVNPLLDTTGSNCGEGQSGQVWFLAGTRLGGSAVRSCTIPTGRALFFPIVNAEADITDCPTFLNLNADELRVFINDFIDSVTTLEAQVDGVSIQDLQKSYRAGPDNPAFSITLPSNNIDSPSPGCVPMGTYFPAVSDGYYLMLAPLSVGQHKIHFKAAAPNFMLDVTYYLTVQPD